MEDVRGNPNVLTPEVREQLERLRTSPQFINSERLHRFLTLSVQLSLAGDIERLKESAIGVEIFGRPVGYDPKADSIVRVEAYRLRQKLTQYYEGPGSQDPIRFVMNKGSYATVLESRAPSLPAVTELPPPPARRGIPWWIPALAGAALVVLLMAGWRAWAPSTAARGVVITKLTSDGGWSGDPVMTPDGRSVVYSSDRGGEDHLSLWYTSLSGGEPLHLTRNEADEIEPDVSPDGKTVIYRSRRGDSSGIYRVPVAGGASELVVQGGSQPRFSPDGRWILYTVRNEQEWSPGRIYVVPAEGGAPRQLATAFADAHYAIWSQDGNSILFCGTHTSGLASAEHDWWVQPFPGGEPIKTGVFPAIKKQSGESGFGPPSQQMERPGDWIDGRIYYAASQGVLVSLWRLPLNPVTFTWAGVPAQERLTYSTGLDLMPRVRGKRMVFSSGSYNVDVWTQEIASGNLRRLVSHPAGDTFPTMDPSGRYLAFTSDRQGRKQVLLRDLREQVDQPVRPGKFSQDYAVFDNQGKWLAFREQANPKVPIYLAQPGNPEGIRRICDDCGGPTDFSPDDRFLLFEPGATIAYVGRLELASGAQMPFLTHPEHSLRGARYSPDGRWIAFYEETGSIARRIWLARGDAPSLPATWIPVTTGENADMSPAWSTDGGTVYYLSDRDGHRCIYGQRIDRQTGRPVGESFVVQHHHSARRSLLRLTRARLAAVGLRVVRDQFLFSMDERSADLYSANLPE